MAKSNEDFRKLISSNQFVLIPQEETNSSNGGGRNPQRSSSSNTKDAPVNDAARLEKKRKREDRKKKYVDRRKAAKEKERAKQEEEEFTRQLQAKLAGKNGKIEDLPQEYRKLIGGDLERTHLVKGIDWNLLRQTKDNMARQQIEDIEDAYHAAVDEIEVDVDKSAAGTDVSDLMQVQTQWADDINKSVLKYFHCNRETPSQPHSVEITRNPKFCNGMLYKFHVAETEDSTSIPTEVIRSRVAYGLQLDDDWHDEFDAEHHVIGHTLCSGYTPPNVMDRIANALQRCKDGGSDRSSAGKKRTFSEMETQSQQIEQKKNTNSTNATAGGAEKADDKNALNSDKNAHVVDDDDDFDIFDNAGRDYVCDPDLSAKDPKRRRVAFAAEPNTTINTPSTTSYFEPDSATAEPAANAPDVRQAAASILKSSMTKAKIENLKLKRKMILHTQELPTSNAMPSLESNGQGKSKNNEKMQTASQGSSLRGKLLSSGFATFDDDDDEEETTKACHSDDEEQSSKSMTNANAEQQWKNLQEKFGDKTKISKNIKAKLK